MKRLVLVCVAVFVLAGTVPRAQADYSQSVVVSPNSWLTVVRSDPAAVPNTFLQIVNPSMTDNWTGQVQWIDGAVTGTTNPSGYTLLDTTLRITWNNQWSPSLPWPQYGRGIGYRQARLTRKGGISASTLLVMRRVQSRVYQPGYLTIRQRNRPLRVYGSIEQPGVLGHYGVNLSQQYAWAVVDKPGDYVLAGLPEPATLSVLVCGAGAGLAMLRRRRA